MRALAPDAANIASTIADGEFPMGAVAGCVAEMAWTGVFKEPSVLHVKPELDLASGVDRRGAAGGHERALHAEHVHPVGQVQQLQLRSERRSSRFEEAPDRQVERCDVRHAIDV